ncbi:MAG: hypothetical protein ACSLEN_05545 [Candidatus Malihini olakiniferum]
MANNSSRLSSGVTNAAQSNEVSQDMLVSIALATKTIIYEQPSAEIAGFHTYSHDDSSISGDKNDEG